MNTDSFYCFDKKTSRSSIIIVVGRILVLSFFAFAFSAHAEFINTYTDGKQRAWIDTSSKEGTGNIRRIMELINYKDKQAPRPGLEYTSMIYQYQSDCNKRAFKVLMSVAFEKHQGQGRQIFRDDTPTPNYIGVKDGNSVYEAFAIACR